MNCILCPNVHLVRLILKDHKSTYKKPIVALLLSVGLLSLAGCMPSAVPTHKTEYINPGQPYDLNSGWVCRYVKKVTSNREELSEPSFQLTGWMPATVSGMILTTLGQFTKTAQLVNYDQYRGLIEGHLAHMWDWYTGMIIWKTQNPWTALRGQMYDYYLDPNGELYGLRHAGEPLHVMYGPTGPMASIVNQTFHPYHNIVLQGLTISIAGKDSPATQRTVEVSPTSAQRYLPLGNMMQKQFSVGREFMDLRLVDSSRKVLSDNLYWLSDSSGQYTGLHHMKNANTTADARWAGAWQAAVRIKDPKGEPLGFFNRVSLLDTLTSKRILPVFYTDNYISVLPGQEKTVFINCTQGDGPDNAEVSISGWNVPRILVPIKQGE